jgi:hypothetical protein
LRIFGLDKGSSACQKRESDDGHIEFVKIRKGVFVGPEYRVLPFAELDQLVPAQP